MKFLTKSKNDGSFTLTAIADGKWDGHPKIDTLTLDYSPQRFSPDRTAVAATLAFGMFSGGRLEFPQPIDVTTAESIQDYLRPARVQIVDVHDGPTKPVSGVTAVRLDVESNSLPSDVAQTERRLVCLPRTEFIGSIAFPRGLVVSTNANLISIFADNSFSGAYLALAVMLASDLDSDTIVVPGNWVIDGKVRALLASVNLRILTDGQFEKSIRGHGVKD